MNDIIDAGGGDLEGALDILMGDGFYSCKTCGDRLIEGEQVYCAACRDADGADNDAKAKDESYD